MKKSKLFMLILCLVVCFGFTYSANAETPLAAKQLLLNKLQSSDFGSSDIYKTSSGNVSYEIKALGGALVQGVEPLNKLAGSFLKMGYKLDSPEKKLEAKYNIAFNGNSYRGDLFLDNDKVIMSTEILSLLKEADPNFSLGGEKGLPQYVYINDKEFAKAWDNLIKGQNIPPEFRDLALFVFEAVPDKYFTTSLVNQTVSLSIDQKGMEDIALSVLQKIKNERERYATLMANLAGASESTQSTEEIKKSILADLDRSIADGTYPDTPEKLQKLLAGMVVLKELTYEASLLPSGQNKLNLAVDFGGDSALNGKLTFNAGFVGDKENQSGKYALNLTAQENTQKIKADGQLNGEFKQTAVEAKSNVLLNVNVKDLSGAVTFLDFALQGNSDARLDQNVQVNVPVLTDSNSMNIERQLKNIPEVIVDGKPLVFDVDPFVIKTNTGDQVIVPLRSLAEALGCEVTWEEPNQININREDKSITMYVNRRSYVADGVEKQMEFPPFLKDGKRVMVPLRLVAEELGCRRVDYVGNTKTVFIDTK